MGDRRVRLAGLSWLASAALLFVFAAAKVIAGAGAQAPVTFAHAISAAAAGTSLLLLRDAPIARTWLLLLSAAWALASVAWGVFLMAAGTSHWANLGATVAMAAALVFSLDALVPGGRRQ